MKRFTFITLICIAGFAGFGQDNSENYVLQLTPQIPLESLGNAATSHAVEDVNAQVQYFDGLGRPIQTLQYQASPSMKDIISFVEYDDLGRVPIDYLPYTISNTNLGLQSNPITDQFNFYQGTEKVAQDSSPFAEKIFDGSPLNRVIEQGAPGSAWQIDKDAQGVSTQNGKTIKSEIVKSLMNMKRKPLNIKAKL